GHNVNQNFNWETDVFRAWGINSPLEPQVGQFISAIHAQMPPGIGVSKMQFGSATDQPCR
ncbi:hypothetical protein QT743_22430, partial [Xanthomonas citri pv. citri]